MRRTRSDSGSMLAELALSFPMFILFLITGFETLRLHYNYIAVQILVNRGVEAVRLNPCTQANCSDAGTIAAAQAAQVRGLAQGLGIGGNNLNVCISTQTNGGCLQTNPPNCINAANCAVGQPREIFLVRARRPFSFAFGLRTIWVDALGIGRHEPRIS